VVSTFSRDAYATSMQAWRTSARSQRARKLIQNTRTAMSARDVNAPLLQQLVQDDDDQAGEEELADDEDGVTGPEGRQVAVHAGHDVRHGLADRDQDTEELPRRDGDKTSAMHVRAPRSWMVTAGQRDRAKGREALARLAEADTRRFPRCSQRKPRSTPTRSPTASKTRRLRADGTHGKFSR